MFRPPGRGLSVSENDDFQDLIARVRAGDQDAATKLVLRFEAQVRRAVKTQLHDHRLRRSFDSVDICQSVLGASSCARPWANSSSRKRMT